MKSRHSLYNFSSGDMFIITIILFIAIYFILGNILNTNNKSKIVHIFEQGKLVRDVELTHSEIIRLNKMQLLISNNKICVLESDCPKQICKNSGWISEPNQIIVCVPNKILVEIEGFSQNNDYQGISK